MKTEEVIKRFSNLKVVADTAKLPSTDVKPERLPAHNPYVGSFHRGHKVSNADVPTFDYHPERVPAKNPYLGMFNHSPRPLRLADKFESEVEDHEFVQKCDALMDSIRSQAATPAGKYPAAASPPLEKRQKRGASLGTLDHGPPSLESPPRTPSPPQDSNVSTGAFARTETVSSQAVMKERAQKGRVRNGRDWFRKGKTRSFADVNDLTRGIQTPELCGLQAIVPKQSGVRILDKVGEGTFAKVVVALNKRNKGDWKDPGVYRRLFAIPNEGDKLVLKVQKKEKDDGASMREIEIHGRCSHPNIPKMYGFYEDGRNIIMILEFVDGRELKDVMEARRMFPEEEARLIVLQVARALAYMHGKNFAHRDVSSRNVMVGSHNRAFLIDLGLAVDLTQNPNPAPVVGTLGYVSPESMRGESAVMAGDMWALGCILYEMLFGFSPFLPAEVLMPHMEVPFPDPSWGMDSSPQVQDLIKQLLNKDEKRRISASDSLTHEWFTSEAVEAVEALAPTVHAGSSGEDVATAEEAMDVDLVGEGQPVTKTCLAVDLLEHPNLKSKEGEHQNLFAEVFIKTDSISQTL